MQRLTELGETCFESHADGALFHLQARTVYGLTEKVLDILRYDYNLVLSPAALFPVHFHILLGCKSESWVVVKRSIFHRDFFSI
jgi:hypothetical protein